MSQEQSTATNNQPVPSNDYVSYEADVPEKAPEDLSSIHPALAKYTHLQRIGAGGQGTMLCAVAPDGNKVAIKVFDLQKTDSLKAIELFEREIDTLRSIDVHGVPGFIEDIRTDTFLYLVEDYINAPSLEKRMKSGKRYTFSQIQTIMENAAKILKELGELVPPVIHRDIKPANLLVDDELNVTLVDFGVVAAKVQESFAMTFAGTAGYLAPEQLYGKATPASDVFSLGVTIAHLVTGKAPCDMSMDGMKLDIDKYIPANIPKWFVVVLDKMIDPNATDRLKNGKEVLEYLQRAEANLVKEVALSPVIEPKPTPNDFPESIIDVKPELLYEKNLNLSHKAFNECIKDIKLATLEVPWFLIVACFPVFLVVNLIFLDAPMFSFLTDWLPGVLPIIIALSCIMMDPAEKPTKEEPSRYVLVENAKKLNEIYKNEILHPSRSADDKLYKSRLFSSLSSKLAHPNTWPAEKIMPLTEEENQSLDAYLNDESALYPCLQIDPNSFKEHNDYNDYDPPKLHKTLIFPIVLSIFLIAIFVFSFFGGIRLWWQCLYFFMFALFIYRTIRYYTSNIKYYQYYTDRFNKYYADPRYIYAYELYVRRFLEECRKSMQ
ncbi:MAG: serine/threonine protein kinase [Proteobacteria bacterium]|nr:serine/threonine protein kinase [Pseudomonadota bacterium]